jgi:hypothetical protein
MKEDAQKKPAATDTANPALGEYQPPAVESHNPLEIMSAWEDRSSELEY